MKSLLLTILLITPFGVATSQVQNLTPKQVTPIDIDQDLIDNLNTPENLAKCEEIYKRWQKEGRDWQKATPDELKQLRFCNEVITDAFDIVGEGCSWYCGAVLGKQTASSSLREQGSNSYKPTNAHDLSYKTAWVEGVPGYGIGEYIEYEFPPESPRITTVIVANGYVKTQTAWDNNSRVKKLKMYVNGKPHAYLNLEDRRADQSFEVATIGFSDRENFDLLKTKAPWILRFEIIEVYEGKKYDDVAITEIYFNGVDVHCLGKGTRIAMADGTEKVIEELKIGDEVRSYNSSKGIFESSRVMELANTYHSNLIEIIMTDRTRIVATGDHPFYGGSCWYSFDPVKTRTDYQYDSIEKLSIGTRLLTTRGLVAVAGINQTKKKQLTYTIVRLDHNSMFIANGIAVGVEELRSPEIPGSAFVR